MKSAKYPLLAIMAVLFAFVMSVAMRLPDLREETGAQGLEASYHVLWTGRALAHSSPASHHYLPTVTRDPTPGNPISWGGTVATPGGSYVYTSFPPLGFLIPTTLMNLRKAGGSFCALGLLNTLIGLAAALMLAGLARASVLGTRSESDGAWHTGWIVFGLIGVCYLFLRESLVAHGSVYWAQSPAQLTLIAGSWSAYRLFQGRGGGLSMLVLGLACLVYPLLEWTGFVFDFGVFLAFGYTLLAARRGAGGMSAGTAALVMAIVVLAALAAGIGTLVHYFSVIGVEAMFKALAMRANARRGRAHELLSLSLGYFISFGALVPLAALAAWRAIERRLFRGDRAFWLLLFVTSFPAIENVLLMQHASEFSFDRLKLAVPMLLLGGAVLAAEQLARHVAVLVGIAYLVIASNVEIFANDQLYYRPWGEAVKDNRALVESFGKDPLASCAAYASSGRVRGYLNLLFDRDIYEQTDMDKLAARPEIAGRCGVVMIGTKEVFTDLPRVTGIEVFDAGGRLLRSYPPAR
jgi:hypothetical protein